MNNSGINSPYSTGIAPNARLDQGDISQQIRAGKEEEQIAKQTGVMPYPLESLTPLLTDAFSALVQVRNLLDTARNQPEIDKAAIDKAGKTIDNMCKAILDLPELLDIIEL